MINNRFLVEYRNWSPKGIEQRPRNVVYAPTVEAAVIKFAAGKPDAEILYVYQDVTPQSVSVHQKRNRKALDS